MIYFKFTSSTVYIWQSYNYYDNCGDYFEICSLFVDSKIYFKLILLLL